MIKATKHPFLTFVISGFAAFVLIGGALASLTLVQRNQDTSTQAYRGSMQIGRGAKDKLFCGKVCRTDSECGGGGYCLLGKMPECPAGKMCAQVMPLGVCRAAACSGDEQCSCAPRATLYPRPSGIAVPMPTAKPDMLKRAY